MNKYLLGHNSVLTELPRLSSLDNADTISQIQVTVDAALTTHIRFEKIVDDKTGEETYKAYLDGRQINLVTTLRVVMQRGRSACPVSSTLMTTRAAASRP